MKLTLRFWLAAAMVSLISGACETSFAQTKLTQTGNPPANAVPGGAPSSSAPNGSRPGSLLGQEPRPGGLLGGLGGSMSGANAQNDTSTREVYLNNGKIIGLQAAVKCIHDVRLAPHVDGILQELLVDEGSPVEAGQHVLSIDERTALAELAVAEKEAEAAAAQASQDANLRFSLKVAEVSAAEYEEVLELYKRTSASRQETRRKLLEFQKAELGTEVAKVDHQKDILAAEVAREKVQAAKVNLNLRKVTSKYDGVIVERMRDVGEWVKAGEPVFRLVHLKEMRVVANVPVRGISVSQLQNAPLKLRVNINGEEWTYDSKVEFVSSVIEMSHCRVWATVPNPPVGSGWLLREGLDALVDIDLSGQTVQVPGR